MLYVVMYLTAVVAANLSVAMFGPSVSILNAFLFIGLNLTARDKLHDLWHGEGLVWKMGGLILTGAVISFALGAGMVAVASFVAFAASEAVDSISYHILRGRDKLLQVNGSNVLAAGVDSVIFPLLAFGWPLLWWVVLGQFVAKVGGGLIWSWWLFGRRTAVYTE
jgi:uncharacterized PurR-regulated membrane protein YhhQ (DUF165 family)